MGEPIRVQLRRTKGWKMPPNTVKVARPSIWGNPFRVTDTPMHGPNKGKPIGQQGAVDAFRSIVELDIKAGGHRKELAALRGKNLACWCSLGQPCHADVLLELANTPKRNPADPCRGKCVGGRCPFDPVCNE